MRTLIYILAWYLDGSDGLDGPLLRFFSIEDALGASQYAVEMEHSGRTVKIGVCDTKANLPPKPKAAKRHVSAAEGETKEKRT